MVVWSKALWLVRTAGRQVIGRRRRRVAPVATTPQQSRELAEMMRMLPGQYADRLTPRAVQRITEEAASGQWERAITALIRALEWRGMPITDDERAELAMIAGMLAVPAEHRRALQPEGPAAATGPASISAG
ncbi:hypothetical protein GCM10029978_074640 [Actinoallomurus acanthiterrae]